MRTEHFGKEETAMMGAAGVLLIAAGIFIVAKWIKD
jgi:hypothetical protein